jgi:hypothetical protein
LSRGGFTFSDNFTTRAGGVTVARGRLKPGGIGGGAGNGRLNTGEG